MVLIQVLYSSQCIILPEIVCGLNMQGVTILIMDMPSPLIQKETVILRDPLRELRNSELFHYRLMALLVLEIYLLQNMITTDNVCGLNMLVELVWMVE